MTEQGASGGVVNAQITWPQLWGGIISDVEVFVLAAMPGVITFLGSNAPFTTRAIVSVALSGIMAGLLAVQRVTLTDGLALRLRASGQLNKGV